MIIFEETGILDINNINIKRGNVVKMLKSAYGDTISSEWYGVVLGNEEGEYGIYFGKWYGDNVLDPKCFGKCMEIDKTDNHKLLVIGTVLDTIFQ